MKEQRFFQFFLLLGTALCMLGILLYFKQGALSKTAQDPYSAGLLTQNTYMGPTAPIQGNPQLIRIQVLIYDSPNLGGVEIQNVAFNGQSIPLKPRDIYGFRGQGSLQFPPGKYTLRWTVQRDKVNWPRNVTHEELVTLDPRDLWIQIQIQGETASIQ